jgi:hypothetical protein
VSTARTIPSLSCHSGASRIETETRGPLVTEEITPLVQSSTSSIITK